MKYNYFYYITFNTITFSLIIYINNLYNKIFNNFHKKDKETQTDFLQTIDNETQTFDNKHIDINSNSYVEFEYIHVIDSQNDLENLMLLAVNQMVIQKNPSNYQWIIE
tara:strand:- start:1062 stop:1385 length:324 start_codon:yes stop_codon:yes gene_type:complete